MDRSKVKLWLFTNAYVTHGKRVVHLLGVEDMFEGITYCDYAAEKLLCKPDPAMFAKAMKEAGVSDVKDCYFVGMNTFFAMWICALLTYVVQMIQLLTAAKQSSWGGLQSIL